MTKKNSRPRNLSAQEQQLIKRLREHPDWRERFENILEISANAAGPVKSADEVEGLLIEELRHLGNTTMGNWALSAEQHLGGQFKQMEASARVRKKKR